MPREDLGRGISRLSEEIRAATQVQRESLAVRREAITQRRQSQAEARGRGGGSGGGGGGAGGFITGLAARSALGAVSGGVAFLGGAALATTRNRNLASRDVLANQTGLLAARFAGVRRAEFLGEQSAEDVVAQFAEDVGRRGGQLSRGVIERNFRFLSETNAAGIRERDRAAGIIAAERARGQGAELNDAFPGLSDALNTFGDKVSGFTNFVEKLPFVGRGGPK